MNDMKYLDRSTGTLRNYNNQPNVNEVFDTREWIHSSWIAPWGKKDMLRRMTEAHCSIEIAPEGFIIHPPRNRVFALKWCKTNNSTWRIIEFCYKII